MEKRCTGFLSDDGDWAHCSRPERAGPLDQKPGSETYAHRMHGSCKCGVEHGPAKPRAAGAGIEAIYDYRDEAGGLLFQVVRKVGKRFMQRRPVADAFAWHLSARCKKSECPCQSAALTETRRVLYRLPELLASPTADVYIVEGEKDVDALRRHGFVATCNPHGALKWRFVVEQARVVLRDRTVVVIPDVEPDDPGEVHADQVAASLHGIARTVRVIPLPGAKDAAEWLGRGGTAHELAELVRTAPLWAPSAKPRDTERAPAPAAPPAPAASGVRVAGWESLLLHTRNKDGTTGAGLRNVVANACTILAHDPRWAGILAHDDFAETIVTLSPPPWRATETPAELKPGDWTDGDSVRTQCFFSEHYGVDVGPDTSLAAVSVVAYAQRVHPVRDWLQSLRWDARKRAPSWLVDVFGCDDTPYVRAVGQAFLVACVARIMSPGCKVDTIPILEGAQGIGKSSCLRALVGDEWFLEMSVSDVTNVDAMQVLRRKWIFEMPEIDGWSRTETGHFKGFLSRQVDTYRASYGRGSRDYPRQSCGIGTTNALQYLKDETGNRRFWPVACRRGDVAMVRALRPQLWAEALARYQGGEAWHITDPELLDAFALEQDTRYQSDAWEERVEAWLMAPASPTFQSRQERGVTTADIYTGLGGDLVRMTTADSRRMASVLHRLGWTLTRERAGTARDRRYRPAQRSDSPANGAAHPLGHVLPLPGLDDSEPPELTDDSFPDAEDA